MYATEEDEYACCAACGCERSWADRVYALGGKGLLCFECATSRHGVYEELFGRWTVKPQIDDLPPRPGDGCSIAEGSAQTVAVATR